MSNLSQTDLNVRLQKIRCCIASKGEVILDKIKTGSKDVNCKLQELQLIEAMFDAIKCYNVEDTEALATGTVGIGNVAVGDTIDFLVNGVSIIGGPRQSPTSNGITLMQGLTNLINSLPTGYTASFVTIGRFKGLVTITGTCKNEALSYTLEGDPSTEIEVTGLSDGFCSTNCLTEEEVQAMIDYIAAKCDLCLQDPGFDYES